MKNKPTQKNNFSLGSPFNLLSLAWLKISLKEVFMNPVLKFEFLYDHMKEMSIWREFADFSYG